MVDRRGPVLDRPVLIDRATVMIVADEHPLGVDRRPARSVAADVDVVGMTCLGGAGKDAQGGDDGEDSEGSFHDLCSLGYIGYDAPARALIQSFQTILPDREIYPSMMPAAPA
jgi:hypothetical protein